MPNWNKTKYVFIGSKEEIGKLYEIIENTLNNETNKSGDFGNDWLGFIVQAINENPYEVYCRGYIESPKLINETTLKFNTWTAWTSCYELFELICKHYPTLEYYFVSTEPNNGIYQTNDKNREYFRYDGKYKIIGKDEIRFYIEIENVTRKIYGNGISNDSIYLKIPIG